MKFLRILTIFVSLSSVAQAYQEQFYYYQMDAQRIGEESLRDPQSDRFSVKLRQGNARAECKKTFIDPKNPLNVEYSCVFFYNGRDTKFPFTSQDMKKLESSLNYRIPGTRQDLVISKTRILCIVTRQSSRDYTCEFLYGGASLL